MKLAIIGATGNAGGFLLKETLRRRIDTTAIVRHPEKLPVDTPYLKKDLFDITTADLKNFDVVIDAFNAPKGKEEMHVSSLAHLIKILDGTSIRLFVVGGFSSLFTDNEKKQRMIDLMPEDSPYYATAFNMSEALKELKESNLNWTYLSPASYFNPAGVRTGSYRLSDDVALTNARGQSEISMADYAIAMLDAVESNQHNKQHISAVH